MNRGKINPSPQGQVSYNNPAYQAPALAGGTGSETRLANAAAALLSGNSYPPPPLPHGSHPISVPIVIAALL